MFVLRTLCLCGLNLGCALEDWLSRWRQRLHVRSLISGWRWALGLECSLLFCSSPWPATSGRRTKSRILVFGGIQPPLFLVYAISFMLLYLCVLIGWSISIPNSWCQPIKSVSYQRRTAAPLWKEKEKRTRRTKWFMPTSLLFWLN